MTFGYKGYEVPLDTPKNPTQNPFNSEELMIFMPTETEMQSDGHMTSGTQQFHMYHVIWTYTNDHA